jgi:hypothetical protein
LLAGVLVWNVPLAGQWRNDRSLTALLPQSPPGPGPWVPSPVTASDLFDESGLRDQVRRNFNLHGIRTVTFDLHVRRFDSPTWAWLYTHRRSPSESDKPWTHQSVRPIGSAMADDQSYTCLIRDKTFKEQGCEAWSGELRYGQYVVTIKLSGKVLAADALDLLQQAVRSTETLLPD